MRPSLILIGSHPIHQETRTTVRLLLQAQHLKTLNLLAAQFLDADGQPGIPPAEIKRISVSAMPSKEWQGKFKAAGPLQHHSSLSPK